MSDWVCDKTELRDGGRVVTMELSDNHSTEFLSITLSAREWTKIIQYRAAAATKEKEIAKIARALGSAILDLNREQWERREKEA